MNASVSNEFAAVGFRAYSMVHGEVEVEADRDAFPAGVLEQLESQGVEVAQQGDEMELAVPLNVAFGNPDLVELIGLEQILAGLAAESQRNNDEQIDEQLRSVLFQLPRPDVTHDADCLDGDLLDQCFDIVLDLGALDIAGARDHGIARYNDLQPDLDGSEPDDFDASRGHELGDLAYHYHANGPYMQTSQVRARRAQ